MRVTLIDMKMIRKIAGSLLLLFVFSIFSSYSFQESGDKDRDVLRYVIAGLSRHHYHPQMIDDDFSQKVFDNYLQRLDPFKRFLTQIDIENLSSYKYQIDDELSEVSFEFFDLSQKIYFQRLNEAQAYYQEILATPFDFQTPESYDSDFEDMPFAQDKTELKEYWRKRLKYEVLYRLERKIEAQKSLEEKGENGEGMKTEEELEKEAREEVQENYLDFFTRMDKLNEDDLRTDYINAVTHIFDPHTQYFPPKEKQDFDIRMSGQLEGIGARLTEKEGLITVAEIVVGSPCYKQGDLEVNDVITKVAQGDEEPVNVVGMRTDDAVLLIRGKKGTEVRLTVKKVDGTEMIIPIIRDVVRLEETYAKSLILEENGEQSKVGYIYLPQFYVDFQNLRGGRRCAVDVAKEIEKLKSEQVNGIILDLRDNGGGSLQDVVEMTGLFIEEGPIVQVKGRNMRPYVHEDKDNRVQYDGPLVILVNRFSASASEIMAAAIQDYGRGVIIGGEYTYGKGTVQRFLNLNRYDPSAPPMGDLKLTIQKFYRINGGTTQREGVVPDIVLPFYDRYLELGEKEDEFAMAWDEIDPVEYQKWSAPYDIQALKAQSEERVAGNATFKMIEENARRLQMQQEDTQYPLNLEGYSEKIEQMKQEADKYKNITEPIDGFVIATLNADLADIHADETKTANRKKWIGAIQKDPYIFEALQVIQDMQ